MPQKRLLIISTDRLVFEEGSAVRARVIENAKEWEEVHVIVFKLKIKNNKLKIESQSRKDEREDEETAISPNCWAYSTRSRFRLSYPFDAIRLGRFIVKRRGITNISCQDASLTAMTGLSLKKEFGIPLEINVHEDLGSKNYAHVWTNKVRKAMALHYLTQADSIRAVSSRIKDYLIEKLKIEDSKITVRPIAVDVDFIKNAAANADLHEKYTQFEKIMLMASRMEKEKNIELAIRAWQQVTESLPKAGLIVVGAGSQLPGLKSLVSDLNLGGRIIFEPWADKKTLASYYKTADAFLNTSLFEGYGMTLVEAQAAGCPVISTDVGIARDVGATIVDWKEKSVAEAVISILKRK